GRFGHEGLGFLGMSGDLPLAKQVQRKSDVSGLGESQRLIPRVLVVAPPLVHYQDAGPLFLRGFVPGEKALQRGGAIVVVHDFRFHRGASRRGEREKSRKHPVRLHFSSSQVRWAAKYNGPNSADPHKTRPSDRALEFRPQGAGNLSRPAPSRRVLPQKPPGLERGSTGTCI